MVAEVREGTGLLRTVTVVPRVDFDKLEEVLVLKRTDFPLEPGDTRP